MAIRGGAEVGEWVGSPNPANHSAGGAQKIHKRWGKPKFPLLPRRPAINARRALLAEKYLCRWPGGGQQDGRA